MPRSLALALEILTTVMTIAGMGYFLAAYVAAIAFGGLRRLRQPQFAPAVSILKSLKGSDPDMLEAFRSHCHQHYSGEYELLFGVSDEQDPACAVVRQLQSEFADRAIRLVVCPLRLGTNGKVSTLAQLAPLAQHPFLLINDSDIFVGEHYLERVMTEFAVPQAHKGLSRQVGLVTTLYRGRVHGTLWSRIEALTISTEFAAGVLLARMLEGGLSYGLGATLAVRREALTAIGGFEAVADYLADDYELGAKIHAAGYAVALGAEVVETGVPAYRWRGFADHQLRWYRTVRDLRLGGYIGLVFVQGLTWALLNVLVSGLSPLSLWLAAMSFLLRLAMAMRVGAGVLGDRQVLPSLWLVPLRDLISTGLWLWGFASNTILWRGDRFELKAGKLHRV